MDESKSGKNVVVYSTPTCMYCKMAKEYFQENSIDFVDHDVTTDEVARKEMMDKTSQMGVPVIDVDGEIVIGFDKEKLASLLGLDA
ncbi:MAG: glutaredoxin domain-containing protein [bacterium]|nr:glutaredoxin domain-containing protein [bacterium]